MLLQMNTELLKQKMEMLEEYFCINIDKHGNLSRLPVVLDQYTPDIDRLPEFVLCLGNDVGSKVYNNLVFYPYFFPFCILLILWMMIIDLKGIVSFCSEENVPSLPTYLEICINTHVHSYRCIQPHLCNFYTWSIFKIFFLRSILVIIWGWNASWWDRF